MGAEAMKVYIAPYFTRTDNADGGIRRVVEAQRRYLPEFGIECLDSPIGADVIACHGATLEERPGVPMVSHGHGLYWDGIDWPAWAFETNRQVIEVMCRAVAHTAPSEWVAAALRRGGLFYPEVVYHGVDSREWTPGQNGRYVLWNKARHDPVSDAGEAAKLAALMPDTKFVSTIGAETANLKICGVLALPDMQPIVQNAGLYLATARETFGVGTLEALASGVPVVGWAHGGQLEIVRDGETGYLAPPGDWEALIACVRRAFSERNRLGANARADAISRWGWRPRIAQYADLYRRVHAEYSAPRPKVSVVVTCHNLARFLNECLASVSAQTMGDWECVIVDDASTDETPAVAHEWQAKDARFVYASTPENLKLSGALNFGIARSRGRYVLPLDADNTLDPNALIVLSTALDADSSIHIAYGHLDVVDERGENRRRNDWPWPAFNWRAQMAHLNQITSTALVRREVYERAGGYRLRAWRAEDAALWSLATSSGFRAKKVTELSVFTYRDRADSKSKSEHGDGDWTAWYPWRIAGSHEEAQSKRSLVVADDSSIQNSEFVPFAAQGKPPKGMRCWPVLDHIRPFVSVIIPCGPGHESPLIDAVESVFAQDYAEWECIVVNDTGKTWPGGMGSPVAGAPYARVIETGATKGTPTARNAGAKAARGTCLLWLDADDYLLPGVLAKMVATYQAQPGVIYGDWLRNDSDRSIPMTHYESWDFECGATLRQMQHSVTCLVPRELHEKIGGFDEKMRGWEDWDYFIALQAAGACSMRVPEPVFVYRFRAGTRRDDSFGQGMDLLQYIRDKWKPYYERKKEMPCAGCPQPKYKPLPPPATVNAPQAGASGAEAVLLYYDGPLAQTHTVVGPVTATQYRFGHDAAHRQKYVHAADAPEFLARRTHGKPHFVKVERISAAPAPVTVAEATQAEVDGGPLRPDFPVMEAAMPIVAPAPVDVLPAPPNGHEPESGAASIVDLTLKEIRNLLPDADESRLVIWLAQERGGAKRAQVVKLLNAALSAIGEKQIEPA